MRTAIIGTILALTGCVVTTPPRAEADLFLGQHIFYASSWPSVQTGYFDGVRVWSGTSQSATWRDIEPSSGNFNFSVLDQHVAQAQAHNMTLMYTLGQAPAWASARPEESANMGLGAAAEPGDMSLWTRYVTTVATRYRGQISAYEIMNEPRIPEAIKPYSPGFFSGSTDSLVRMTQLAHDAIKAVDPAAKVVCPPMDGGDLGVKRLEYFLSHGGGQYCDAIGFHFYLKTQTVAEFNTLLASVKAAMARQGVANLPLWDTEIGVLVQQSGTNVVPRNASGILSTVLDERDAAALMLKIVLASQVGGIARTYWFAHDSSSMGSTQPNKTIGALNLLGVGYIQAKAWLNDKQPQNCTIGDQSTDCTLLKNNVAAARISWGNTLSAVQLRQAGVRELWLLNGQHLPMASMDDGSLATLSRNFTDPVYLAL
ncbi:Endo-1,4-beta-xylanase, GH35 family [Andreprevotia lacus DSM 23236]|uniref:Endo-1,4-beta-xylanase, GH35 family n=1 Tax=Andreprevotia lacus DSM 23236 TaxID=1121001 RepID=A0A1W1XGZ3_9NEIS|nr:endo-1,4-beta-xylanase [Andreprevotia lacus]SMC23052.1 Endo-1,4-beta-xylanase, GH35 family [Andreprevotia lacus DSM 23236]